LDPSVRERDFPCGELRKGLEQTLKEESMSDWKKSKHLKVVLLVLGVFVLGVTIGIGRSHKVSALSNNVYEDLKGFTDVLGIIQREYVEETKPKDLLYGAIKGMLETLDPHSAFMPPESFKEMQEETKGRFEGIGIEITTKDNVLTVVSPIEGTPAFKAGLRAGDQIVGIDGESTKNMTLMDAVKRLRGPKGSKVTVTIMREGLAKPEDFTLTRDVIPVRSVRYELLDEHYGYVRLSQFQEKTDSDFDKAIRALEEESHKDLKGLILDLRNDPGGLLDQAVKIADRFLDSGVIVSVEGRREDQKMKFSAQAQDTLPPYPLIVLVNEGSASASEIVAGAIQDHGRGVILGTQTFGKASVQTIFPLRDGAGLRLTTARYFTPKGRSIQATGITPDIIVKPTRPEEDKEGTAPKPFTEKDLQRHLMDTGKTPSKDTKDNKENKDKTKKEEVKEKKLPDNQLDTALDLLKTWGIFKNQIKVK
jgi:carboxyl-terminal processing protease